MMVNTKFSKKDPTTDIQRDFDLVNIIGHPIKSRDMYRIEHFKNNNNNPLQIEIVPRETPTNI